MSTSHNPDPPATSDSSANSILTSSWLSAEGAAMTLGISLRTIHRRIRSGELESRLGADGRRHVLVCQAERLVDGLQTPIGGQPADAPAWQSRDGTPMADAAGAIAKPDVLADSLPIERLGKLLSMIEDRHQTETARARRSGRIGWLCAVCAGIALAAILSMESGSRSNDRWELDAARQQLTQARAQASRTSIDRDRVFLELGRALAQVDAQTAGAQIPPVKQPATRPTRRSFIERFAAIFNSTEE